MMVTANFNNTERTQIAKTYTTESGLVDQILEYTRNKFVLPVNKSNNNFFSDESYIESWVGYLNEAKNASVFEVLKSKIVQFKFPIERDISNSSIYRSTTLSGNANYLGKGLELKEPDSMELMVYESFAGRIPVITMNNREDFKTVLCALSYKNEPISISEAIGAAMINGLNNWNRINQYRDKWTTLNPSGDWRAEFINNVVPNPELYKDKLILLSSNNYSNISANQLGIEESIWKEYCLKIRLEHECAHLFTLRYFGTMANNIHDEIIADYMGITKVEEIFRAKWFLLFMGLEDYPNYRRGGRLENYVSNFEVSSQAFSIISEIVYNAAINVEQFDLMIQKESNRILKLKTLCSVDILSMSGPDGANKLFREYRLLNHSLTLHNNV